MLCWIRVLDGFPGAAMTWGKPHDGLASVYCSVWPCLQCYLWDHALVYCIAFPFTLPSEIHGWTALLKFLFTSVQPWPSFKWNLFSKLEITDGLPVSSKLRAVATQAMCLCSFLPSFLKIKPCLETRLTCSSPCHKTRVAWAAGSLSRAN